MKKQEHKTVSLESIAGLHAHTCKLIRQNTGFLPFDSPLKHDIPKEVFDTLLHMSPVIVKTIKDKIYVVGNIRLFNLLKENMPNNYQVHIQEVINRRITEIEKVFWAEHLIQPIIFNRNSPNREWLYQSWLNFNTKFPALWEHKPFSHISTKKDFATTLKTDARNLGK